RRSETSLVISAGKRNGHPGKTRFPGVFGAVIVGVDIHEASNSRRLQFAEVVVDSIVVLGKYDGGDCVIAGRADGIAANSSCRVLAVEEASRLRFSNDVSSGAQIVERV